MPIKYQTLLYVYQTYKPLGRPMVHWKHASDVRATDVRITTDVRRQWFSLKAFYKQAVGKSGRELSLGG